MPAPASHRSSRERVSVWFEGRGIEPTLRVWPTAGHQSRIVQSLKPSQWTRHTPLVLLYYHRTHGLAHELRNHRHLLLADPDPFISEDEANDCLHLADRLTGEFNLALVNVILESDLSITCQILLSFILELEPLIDRGGILDPFLGLFRLAPHEIIIIREGVDLHLVPLDLTRLLSDEMQDTVLRINLNRYAQASSSFLELLLLDHLLGLFVRPAVCGAY